MSAVLNNPRADGLRPMVMDDLDEVVDIENAIYDHPWTTGIFTDCLHIGYCCWVIQEQQQVIAYSIMSVAVQEAHLLTIVVDPDKQGQGYGRRLLHHMLMLAKSHHANTMYLEVRVSNQIAQQLYLDEGFNEIGMRPDYYPAKVGREDALIMAKELID